MTGLAEALPPLPVAAPLLVAGLVLAAGKALPRKAPDVLALLVAVVAALLCAVMAVRAAEAGPLVYWFGGWAPRDGLAIGISFRVDVAGAVLGTFIAGLFAVALVFAWGYFDEVHAHFHVLLLLFMASMTGFCLTADVFNMFVWFEVMSVAAFALTGYALKPSPLEGAINFTVVNTVGSYLLLGGIGLAYSFAGSLDMAGIGRAVAAAPGPATGAAFALMACGLLVKAAQVPFHFWLPDAHAVAPSPVSVIFSGAMVALGVFGLARLLFATFAGDAAVMAVAHTLLFGLGVASVVVGGAMALLQRHVKRLLAFSTVSHVGVLLLALALPGAAGVPGMLQYLVGHGLVKAGLFMVAGILLATCGGIDEIGLRGRGRTVWPVGVAMAAGGLLLAGLPLGLMDGGMAVVAEAARGAGYGWVVPVLVFGAGTTGGAVLRAAGRIFVGLGPVSGEEERSPTDEEQEKADRPLPLMLGAAAVPLLLACLGAGAAHRLARHAAAQLAATAFPPAPAPDAPWLAWSGVALALGLAGWDLFHQQVPRALAGAVRVVTQPVATGLDFLHSGAVGDYVAWLVVGLAMFTAAFALA